MKKLLNNNKIIPILICITAIVIVLFGYNIYKINTKNEINSSVHTSQNDSTETISELDSKVTSNNDAIEFEGLTLRNDDSGVPVLCYHSLSEDESIKSPTIISTKLFREHLQVIKDTGYTTLTMAQLNNHILNNKPIPEKSVVITFDDGYLNNYDLAFPLLKEFNMNATIFVITNSLGSTNYMSPENAKEMSDYGIDIQSHTSNHPELATLSYEEQLNELKASKSYIENITNKPVISIAYPFGSYNQDTIKAATDAGYSIAFTVKKGFADRLESQYELDRILIDYTYKANSIKKSISK